MSPEHAIDAIRSAIPSSHAAFLRGFDDTLKAGDYLFVHAGIRPGIPLAEQEAIFRPHTHGAAATGVAGHGLGLSIVKAIVEAHGGTVGVTSAPGKGATFWFTIPVRVEDIPDEPGVVSIERARRAG